MTNKMTAHDFADMNYSKIAQRYFDLQTMKNRKALTFCTPINIEGRKYQGSNELHLILFSCAFDTQPIFATFNMFKRHGLSVKKGAKGIEVGLFQRAIKKNASASACMALATKEQLEELEKHEHFAFFKRYFVFNVAQCEGVSDVDYSSYAKIKQSPYLINPAELAAALMKKPQNFGLDCAQGLIRACVLADISQMLYETEAGAKTSTYLLEMLAKIAKASKLTVSTFQLLADAKEAFSGGGTFASIIKDARKVADTIISKKIYRLESKSNAELLEGKTAELF